MPVSTATRKPVPEGAACFVGQSETPQFSSCDGAHDDLKDIAELVAVSVQDCVHCTGAENEADLILSRAGKFHDGWEDPNQVADLVRNKFVCQKHLNKYGKKWQNQYLKRLRKAPRPIACMFPNIDGFMQHLRPVKAHHTYTVNKEQSRVLFEKYGKLLPIGYPLCKIHFMQLEDMMVEYRMAKKGYCLKPNPAKSFIESPELHVSPLVRPACITDQDIDFIPKPEPAATLTGEDPVKTALRRIGEAKNIPYVAFPTATFSALSDRVKKRRILATRRITEEVCRVMGKESAASVCAMASLPLSKQLWSGYGNQQLREILGNVKQAYMSSNNSDDRKYVLSLVAPVVTLSLLQEHIPGVTSGMFTAARKLAIETAGVRVQRPSQIRLRRDDKNVRAFIDYIASPHMFSDLPFGQQVTRYSSGQRTDIPNVVRFQRQSRIADEYLEYLRQTERYDEYRLSKSSLLRILSYCPAQTRRSVQGIDYHTYGGTEGIDKLREILNRPGLFDSTFIEKSDLMLKQLRHYLKGDYKISLSNDTKVADHCALYALSDSLNPLLNRRCNHEHNHRCDRCEQGKIVLGDIQTAVMNSPFTTADEKNNVVYEVGGAIKGITEWKKHELRTFFLEENKQQTVKDLKPDTVFITMDFAMKFLPTKYREEQTAWFAKRGISWHVAVAYLRVVDSGILPAWAIPLISLNRFSSGYYSRGFIHVLDEVTKQNSTTVTGILKHILNEINEEVPWVRYAVIRSDNAGAYHSAQTLSAVHAIGGPSGIRIKRWLFSEVQSGKGPCDRMAAVVKRHVRYYIDEGNSVLNSKEFLKAAGSYTGVKSISLYRGTVPEVTTVGLRPLMPGIQNYYEVAFSYDEEKRIRVWRYPGVGEGIAVPNEQWENRYTYGRFEVKGYVHQRWGTPKPPSRALWQYWKEAEADEPDENGVDAQVDNAQVSCAYVWYAEPILHYIL
jgi:hypothetical protein